MIEVLVTGAAGFIGLNLVSVLRRMDNVDLFQYDVNSTEDELQEALRECDLIFHLAGVNRPADESEFARVNAGLTQSICETLRKLGRSPRIVLSSSIQADLNNPYAVSKKAAEDILKAYHEDTGADVVIYRLPNVFGKWSRPNYNTVVATFCHNIARDLPIQISDESQELQLVYIDDVVRAFLGELQLEGNQNGYCFAQVTPVSSITLGRLAKMIESFRKSRDTLMLPDVGDGLTSRLYATYLSFLPPDEFPHRLQTREDQRGTLAEFIKHPGLGQMFVSRTKPGVTRGDHYHHTKVEKFLILEGKGIIRLRNINSNAVLSYPVDGREFKVVDIPPGYTHSIENVGEGELVVLFWASETYDPGHADTESLPVLI
ncbi:capsular biosynthesis protein [Candidatus Woesearchaeota archaeon]|nr:MAG: capsular biosynthesis protein [Candidatus Woesearchaeota archaeon]